MVYNDNKEFSIYLSMLTTTMMMVHVKLRIT